MKLSDHTENIRKLIDTAFRNRLGRMGIEEERLANINSIPKEYHSERKQIEIIREVLIAETGSVTEAYEKLVEEFTFTLFNRLAAIKVMEAHTLHPEIVTRRSQHGDRSFAHKHWLEQNPDGRDEEMEGLVYFIEHELNALSTDIPLFSLAHPYHLMPTAIELNNIINAFNKVETDSQIEDEIWQSDDVLGWLYESYNIFKKELHDDSGLKTEYNKVSIQSQYYTPSWVVKFLVDNSLGKLYLEMYPDSDIKNRYKIANVPNTRTRDTKPLTDIKIIDPATGSGNFLLYAFDLFYDLYTDQIDNYGADYDDRKIAELIIAHNLHGVDLDDRAIQLAQLGLYIKARRKKRSVKVEHFNIVSSDFFLPDFEEVKSIFEENSELGERERKIIADLWDDLQNAYKFGALVRLEEKMNVKWFGSIANDITNQITLFGQENLDDFEKFRGEFFGNLQIAITQNAARQGHSFLNTKTRDAIIFLQLFTQTYDVAVTNPPFTDSADFGVELKSFIEGNYRSPHKFNSNLYATFIKRCFELVDDRGKMALIHPLTFMYIKTFEDVRKFLLKFVHLSVFVEYGNSNLFGSVLVDPVFYVLDKVKKAEETLFISLDQYTRTSNEKYKKNFFLKAFDDYLLKIPNKHNFCLDQSKLLLIDGYPFIYWISEAFRVKFNGSGVGKVNKVATGLMTGDNDKYLRYHWEVNGNEISDYYPEDQKKWVPYQKGGKFTRWYGNNWVVVNYQNDGGLLATTDNRKYYFKEGITYSSSGQKGASFRYVEPRFSFDKGGACIFNTSNYTTTEYLLAYLNSKLAGYIVDCLNPTVNTQKGDIERIPIIKPPRDIESIVSVLSKQNINIKKHLCSYQIFEREYTSNPVSTGVDATLATRIFNYLNLENTMITEMLLNEAIINRLIFDVYDLNKEDVLQVEEKMGKSVGELPVLDIARLALLTEKKFNEMNLANHIKALPAIEFERAEVLEIKESLTSLYQKQNDLEEFCNRRQINPINVWYWFKESKILPPVRSAGIALEFLADAFRTILMADEDGIVPLVSLPGEPRLMDRFEEYCFSQGFTSAQIMQLDALVGRPINEYIENHFFKNLGDHLNLFMYFPKTPFIWHLSSGVHQGFEAYTIIYKWNRDSLYKLKSNYLSNRIESLQYRLQQIADNNTGQAQTEKETIRLQLQEIESFAKKIDELIAEGYDPKLDDGVGKNIAPLQKKGLLRAEILKTTGGKKSQLQKYLNADW